MRKLGIQQIFVALFLFGCTSDDQPKEITIDAKVVKTGGGCPFLIRPIEGSDFYLLDDLPEEYRKNSLEIRLTYIDQNSTYTCSGFLSAREIEIIRIEEN